jgi:N-acetylmuramoyl-L-alanine amidase
VPEVQGPLALRVQYPPADAAVDVRDSSFLFGTAGSGGAAVTVNGVPARVWPNGAWVAWLSFPRESLMHFDIVAKRGDEAAHLDYAVRRAPRFTPPPTPVWIDTTSLTPRGRVWALPDEYVALGVRAAEGATVRLRLPDGTVVPLGPDARPDEVPWGIRAFDRDSQNLATPMRADRYRGVLRGRKLGADPGPVAGPAPDAAPPAAPSDAPVATVEAIVGADTARARWPLQLAVLDTLPQVVELDDDPQRQGGTDQISFGRAAPGASYRWAFPTGTRALATGRVNGDLRLELAPALEAWVPAADARPLPVGTPAPLATVGSLTLAPALDRTTIRIPVGQRIPFELGERDSALTLTLYGARGDLNWIRYGPVTRDSLVRRVAWSQRAGEIVTLDVELRAPVWGYRARWSGTDLVVEVRRPPAVDGHQPLRGRLIVVDPGHPPLGATGPTGFREQDANLAVSLRLRELLRGEGARVVMTRETDTPVELWPRVKLADSLDAELLVSIHNNALPDGVNPFTNNGSSVFYNHPRSLPLARDIQAGLVRRLGLRDLGVGRADLALARPTWMPAVLCEGLYMILPDQEHALQTPEGQEAYAKGVYEGIRQFLADQARRQ